MTLQTKYYYLYTAFVCFLGYLNEAQCDMKLPIVVTGPIGSNPIETNTIYLNEPKPTIVNIEIESNIRKYYDKTSVNSFLKNPSLKKSQEVELSVELPFKHYHVTNVAIQTLGSGQKTYTGQSFNNDPNAIISNASYKKSFDEGRSAVLVKELKSSPLKSYVESQLLSVMATIPAGEKMLVTLEYEGEMKRNSYNKSWSHLVNVHPHQPVQDYKFNIHINETMPVVDPQSFEIKGDWPIFSNTDKSLTYVDHDPKHLHVSFWPKPEKKSSKTGKYEMLGHFYTTYALDKNYLLSRVAEQVTDVATTQDYLKMADEISSTIALMMTAVTMLPMIILTELFNAAMLFMSMWVGAPTKWYLEEKPWYMMALEEIERDHKEHPLSDWDPSILNDPEAILYEFNNPHNRTKIPRSNNWSETVLEDYSSSAMDWLTYIFKRRR